MKAIELKDAAGNELTILATDDGKVYHFKVGNFLYTMTEEMAMLIGVNIMALADHIKNEKKEEAKPEEADAHEDAVTEDKPQSA